MIDRKGTAVKRTVSAEEAVMAQPVLPDRVQQALAEFEAVATALEADDSPLA